MVKIVGEMTFNISGSESMNWPIMDHRVSLAFTCGDLLSSSGLRRISFCDFHSAVNLDVF